MLWGGGGGGGGTEVCQHTIGPLADVYFEVHALMKLLHFKGVLKNNTFYHFL